MIQVCEEDNDMEDEGASKSECTEDEEQVGIQFRRCSQVISPIPKASVHPARGATHSVMPRMRKPHRSALGFFHEAHSAIR